MPISFISEPGNKPYTLAANYRGREYVLLSVPAALILAIIVAVDISIVYKLYEVMRNR